MAGRETRSSCKRTAILKAQGPRMERRKATERKEKQSKARGGRGNKELGGERMECHHVKIEGNLRGRIIEAKDHRGKETVEKAGNKSELGQIAHFKTGDRGQGGYPFLELSSSISFRLFVLSL